MGTREPDRHQFGQADRAQTVMPSVFLLAEWDATQRGLISAMAKDFLRRLWLNVDQSASSLRP
jgi:hypothetical protein